MHADFRTLIVISDGSRGERDNEPRCGAMHPQTQDRLQKSWEMRVAGIYT